MESTKAHSPAQARYATPALSDTHHQKVAPVCPGIYASPIEDQPAYGKRGSMMSSSRLMSKMPDVSIRNNKGQTPLHLASGAGETEIVQALCAAGASVDVLDSKGLSPLQYNVHSSKSSVAVVELLLKRYGMIQLNPCTRKDKAGRNLLHQYLQTDADSEELIHMLLQRGTDINGIDKYGNSPLSIYLRTPCWIKRASICQSLLVRGASKSWSDDSGRNLAHMSMHSLSWMPLDQALSTLKDFGVDIAAKDSEGKGIIHHGAMFGSISKEIITLLRERESLGLHDQDKHGRTPLSYAEDARLRQQLSSHPTGHFDSTLKVLMKT